MAAHRSPSAINGDGAPSTTPGSPYLSATSLHHDAAILDITNASSREHRDVAGTSPAAEYSAIPNDERSSEETHGPFSAKSKGIVEAKADETEDGSLLYQPLNKLATLKQWAFEFLALFVSVAAFALMVILLMAVNEKPQPAWAYVVNINTLVAILTTLLRATVLFVTAEAMGQAKWTWMASPRPLRHVEQFDNASKGAWGSLKFLLHTWKPTPTILYALVVIASYAIGPLSQQAVKTYACEIPAKGLARISIAERVAALDTSSAAGFISGEMSTVAINGLLSSLTGPLDRSQLFDCDSGNCTFESISGVPHSSVGVCSKCSDVRSELHEFQIGNSPLTGYQLRNNSQFAIDTHVEPSPLNVTTSLAGYTTFLALTAAGCVAETNEKAEATQYCPHDYENMPRLNSKIDIVAINCSLYPCIQYYSGNVTNGTIQESLISTQPMDDPGTGVEEYMYGSMIQPSIVLLTTNDGVSYEVPSPCLRILPYLEFAGITYFLSENLKGSCQLFEPLDNIGNITNELLCEDAGWWIKALYMGGNATFEALEEAHGNMATAITNRMRANGLTWRATEASRSYKEGTSRQMSICVRLDGLWLLYPGVLLVLTSALLATAYVQSCQDRGRQPVWKSAILPLLFYISKEQDSDEGVNRSGTSSSMPLLQLTELESLADETVVSFRSGDEGARFVVEE